ncbi:Cyanovirin-N [Ascobolus immersus RN42]|uniref:Cyanovirin-N n=1 Tax=Ascobolus immersus RN42 TaxID=1160509 RepID=A0A3N4HVA8_ASCIM|nr:Cyanovirin-N [Ascobolus immersus RN42]
MKLSIPLISSVMTLGTLLVDTVHAGGWVASCNVPKTKYGGDTYEIKAYCKNKKGEYKWSTVNLDRCIANQDGIMVPRLNGGFSGSCDRRSLGNPNNLYTAECRTIKGGWDYRKSTLDMNTFMTNVDGVLKCDSW